MHERMKKLIFPFFILSMLVLNSYSFAQVEIETANVLSTWTQSDKSTINSWNFYQNQLGSIAFDVLADGDFYCSNYFYACAVDASLNRLVYGQSSNNVVDILNKNFILHQYGLGSGDITFNSPRGAALNNSTIYVSDTGNNRVVKLNHDTAGNITSTEILNGFNQPMRMAMAPDGSAWVADKGNNRVVNTSSGAATGGWQFDSPEAVAVIDYDEILVVDTGNDRVVYLNLSTSEWHTVDFPSDAHLVDVVINDGTEAYVADDGRNLVHKIKLPDEYIASQPQGSPSCLTYGIGIIGVNNSFGNWTLASYNPVKDIKICDVETPSSTPIQYSYLLTMSGSVTEQIKDISTGNVLKNINVNVSTELGASITGVWDLTDDSGNPVAPGQYILRVSSPGCSDEKTIEVLSTAPDITITSPNGGESWVVGEMHAITWTSSNFSGNVKIELSTNGGSSWSDIVSSTDDDGSYGWTVPNAVSSNCRIRISDAADGDPSDESGVFTIESPPVGLHAHWRFDETSGSTAYDASGNGHHATLENGAAFTTGLINNAVELDGSNDNISAGTFDVPPGNGLTIAGWIRPDDFGAVDARILSKAVGVYTDDHYWMLSTHTTSHVLRFRLKTDGSTSTLIAGSGGLTAGEWAHVAATWDGSTMRLYKNAVEVGSMSKTGTLSTNSSAPVTIGNQGGSNPFDGLIDDMRLYNTGLSQSEISDLYQQGANPPPESITVISPNGGENWTVGSNHTINWDSENFSGTVQIEFSDNGGSSWSDIVSSTTDDGSYGWTVPDNVSSNCKIRISDAADGDPSDESGTFSIIEEVVPTGGARVEIDPYNQYDAFVIRVYNNSSDLSITSVDIWNDDAGTFDYVYNGSNCTLSPDMGGNNDFAVQEITLTFSGSGLAPGSSGASGDGDLDCTTKAFVVTVHFSDGSTLSGSMTNQGDSDDANSELWVYDSGGSAPPPPEPSIVVTSPNSGESWAVGSSRTITWDSPNFSGNVKIELSTNGGSSWSDIVSGTADDGSYGWTVPDNVSSTCKIKISDAADGDPSDESGTFSIVSAPTDPIISASPLSLAFSAVENGTPPNTQNVIVSNAGSGTLSWTASTGQSWITLTNTSGGSGDVVTVGVSIAGLAAGTHSGSVTISDPNASNDPYALGVTLVIDPANPPSNDNIALNKPVMASSESQAYYPAYIKEHVNDGNTTIAWGSAYSTPQWITIDLEGTYTIGRVVINWESSYGTSYQIQVSSDNSNWSTIYSTTSGNGGIDDLTVSGSGRYVRMYGTASSLPYGFCIKELEIYGSGGSPSPAITVTSPNGGESWAVGSSRTITWDSPNFSGNVKIELSTNGGSSWSDIVSGTADDGSYGWTVPNNVSSTCKIKISDASDGDPSDVSGTFSIVSAPSGPVIAASPSSLAFSAVENGTPPNTQNVTISNSGGGTLSWTASTGQSWITLTNTSGSTGDGVTVGVDIAGLAAGTYSGSVTISDPNASNDPYALGVNLELDPDDPPPPMDDNIALNKPVMASSESQAYYPAYIKEHVNDGNTNIAWGSAYSTPQWITIDLEDTCTIGRIVLNWESTYGTVYEIRVSNNNSSWTTIYSTSSGDGGIDDVDVSGVGRYVQMYGITSSLPYGFCIREFEIYGYPVLAKRSERTVDNTPIVPSLYTLYQNYPNPFNPKTTIEYDIPESEHVTLTVFNMHGEHVVTIQNGYQPGGHYRVMWDGRDENGRLTASGIYVYKLAAGNFVAAKKMLFVR